MKNIIFWVLRSDLGSNLNNLGMLFFRLAVSIEIMMVHGLKKIGVGTLIAENIPNPFGLPTALNDSIAISANLFFPLLIIFGFMTRMAVIPILAVTLTGYFVVHGNDSFIARDIPFMFSVAFILIGFTGSGKYSLDHYLSNGKGL